MLEVVLKQKHHHGSPKVSGTKNPGIRYFGAWVFPHISLAWWYGPFRNWLHSCLQMGVILTTMGWSFQVGMPTKVRLKNPGRFSFTRVPKSERKAFAVIPLLPKHHLGRLLGGLSGYHVLRRIYIHLEKIPANKLKIHDGAQKTYIENKWWSNTDAQNDWCTTTYFTNSSSGKPSKSKFQLAQAIPLPLLYTPSLFKLLPSSMWLWSAKRT